MLSEEQEMTKEYDVKYNDVLQRFEAIRVNYNELEKKYKTIKANNRLLRDKYMSMGQPPASSNVEDMEMSVNCSVAGGSSSQGNETTGV